jgi:hypothetical protein
MSRTVIFKLYLFDGHIYVDMTKNELKRLIVEVYSEMNEGAISMQNVTETIVWSIKEIIKGFSGTIRNLNYKKPLSEEQVLIIVDKINEVIKKTLVDSKISPCLIEFSKDDSDATGHYHLVLKNITLNSYEYLAKKIFGGGYELIEYKDIKFDKMYNTIEHELIHQQQDDRSKEKYIIDKFLGYIIRNYVKDKGKGLSFEDMVNIVKKDPKLLDLYEKLRKKFRDKKYGDIRKKLIDVNDDDFKKYVEYYNDPAELNTHAKNTVNTYVKIRLKYMNYFIRHGGLTKKDYTSEEVKNYVLSTILKSKSDMFNPNVHNNSDNYQFKERMISYYKGYKFLTVENKKKWWRYAFQLLLGMKFEPIIVKK